MTPQNYSLSAAWLSTTSGMRAWEGFDWVVPHTFRKSVATLLDNEASTKTAASQLGHSAEAMTVKHYVQRAAESPDMSELLQKFDATS